MQTPPGLGEGVGFWRHHITQLERALELERRAFGAKNPKTLKTISHLGRSAYLQGKYPEAESILSQALGVQRRVVGPDHSDTLYSMNILALVYDEQGKYAQAEALHRQTLKSRRRVLGLEHPDTLSSLKSLADVYYEQGEYPQAEALPRRGDVEHGDGGGRAGGDAGDVHGNHDDLNYARRRKSVLAG